MWLGSLKRYLGKHAPFQITWPEEHVFALGVAFAYDSTTSHRINFEKKACDTEESLKPMDVQEFNSYRKDLYC